MDILSAAKRRRMLAPGEKFLLAVSGGPDSVAMLHAMHTHSKDFGISLHIAHLNHGLRGDASDMDAEFVRDLARGFGIGCTVAKVDVRALRAEMGLGEEEAAREARYEFLRTTAANVDAHKIAVGHTADDRAESVLLNVIRGSGIDGLGSIRPVRGIIVRPLIDTWRAEIEAYIREHGLPFRIDETNTDVVYTRNRVRHDLIPQLERDYNPRVKAALLRLAEIAEVQSDLLEGLAEGALLETSYRDSIDAGLLTRLPTALQFQVLRQEILEMKGDLRDVSYEQVGRVIEALNAGGNFTITLPSGVIYAARRGNEFRVRRKEEPAHVEPFDIPLESPGATEAPQAGLVLRAEIIDHPEPHKLPPDECLIDADQTTGKLRVRSAKPGDRIRPLGMAGTKKLQDVFVDKKVPRPERSRAAVVVDDEQVLWVVGVVRSDAAKVTETTQRAIHLSAERGR